MAIKFFRAKARINNTSLEHHSFSVDEANVIRVYDWTVGHYKTVHGLTPAARRRLLTIATAITRSPTCTPLI